MSESEWMLLNVCLWKNTAIQPKGKYQHCELTEYLKQIIYQMIQMNWCWSENKDWNIMIPVLDNFSSGCGGG